MRGIALLTVCLVVGLASESWAQAQETKTIDMSFEACLELIRRTSSQFDVPPINIVETNVLRIVRFVVSDGSVLVSCSRPDQKAVITRSARRY